MALERLGIGIVGVLCCVSSAASYELSYEAPGSTPGSAVVRLDDGRRLELRRGEPSEIGELRSVDENEIVLEQPIDPGERRHGGRPDDAIPEVLRLRLRRSSGFPPGLVPLPAARD
jgi:hypothetical protein